jgi:6-phosphofructokinase 2
MNILTVTVNPVLDSSTRANYVIPLKKTRCESPVHEPGGGGINVSRAIKKLGGKSTAIFIAGGENGKKIEQFLKNEGITCKVINSEQNTRENIMVFDKKTGEHYRFVMPGPRLKEEVWKKLLEEITNISPKPEYLVASGSLPPGVPDDFYAKLAAYSKKNDIRMILDTSGPPLKKALEEGVYMAKPNLRELGELLNRKKLTGMELDRAAKRILSKGYCTILVVSLGAKGALLARQDILEYVVPPVMPVVSAVGAGDSMVAGIIIGCTKGYWPEKAIRYGVAAGTAATMTPGSELCRKIDTDKIYNWLSIDGGEND